MTHWVRCDFCWVSDSPDNQFPPQFFLMEVSRVKPGPREVVPGNRTKYSRLKQHPPWPILAAREGGYPARAGGGAGLGTGLTSAIWISSGSSRGWLGPLARLRFWWAGHMFCRRWLCICLRCFLHRGRIGEHSMASLPGRLGNAHNSTALYCATSGNFTKILHCLHL